MIHKGIKACMWRTRGKHTYTHLPCPPSTCTCLKPNCSIPNFPPNILLFAEVEWSQCSIFALTHTHTHTEIIPTSESYPPPPHSLHFSLTLCHNAANHNRCWSTLSIGSSLPISFLLRQSKQTIYPAQVSTGTERPAGGHLLI